MGIAPALCGTHARAEPRGRKKLTVEVPLLCSSSSQRKWNLPMAVRSRLLIQTVPRDSAQQTEARASC